MIMLPSITSKSGAATLATPAGIVARSTTSKLPCGTGPELSVGNPATDNPEPCVGRPTIAGISNPTRT